MHRFTSNKLYQVIIKITNFRKWFIGFPKINADCSQNTLQKAKPLVVAYRDYKNFLNESFRAVLLSAMERHRNISFTDFHSKCLYLLRKHTSV